MNKRVLVTGSEGFTGQYMVNELKLAGYEVYGIGSKSVSTSLYKYYQADLLNKDALVSVVSDIQPDVIIHLAALSFVDMSNPNAYYEVNLLGTLNLLDAISISGIKPSCILLSSSANVYGNQAQGALNEQTLCSPANHYAASKLSMEYMAKTLMNDLPIILTRPFNYTGVGQADHFLLPKIVSHFRKRAQTIELGNLHVWRDFSDVRTLVYIYRCLIEKAKVGETYNVGSGSMYSLSEVLTLCEEISGHSMEVKVNPQFVRANEVKELRADISKLHACIGDWEKYSLSETLAWMLKK